MDLTSSGMLAVTREALGALRSALMRDTGYAAAGYLQEAGYAGGAPLFRAFREWLAANGMSAPEQMTTQQFELSASRFFHEAGWGTLVIGELNGAVATIDSPDWGEAMPGAAAEHPCCHMTSGMFADFFGRLADAPLAVMEVECRSTGADRCRFLLGSTEMLQQIYDGMSTGRSYAEST